ncbi:hypothetical protein U9M48_008495 [Paspalum notatum var. saurae]|uniref:Uncharacterized protein n=1 Tax=Paspalum notatum var. saurae TaxID=547442 RepID=A0AAQ3WDI8_PASNO
MPIGFGNSVGHNLFWSLTGGARDPRDAHGANRAAPRGSPAYREYGAPPAGRPNASKRRALGPLPNPSDAFAIRPLSTPRRAPKKPKPPLEPELGARVAPPPSGRLPPRDLHHYTPHSTAHLYHLLLSSSSPPPPRSNSAATSPSRRRRSATTLHRLPVLQAPTASSASAPRAQRARYRHRHRLFHLSPRAPLARTRATHGLTVESLPPALSAPPLCLRLVRRVPAQLERPLAPPLAASTAGSTPRRRATPSSRGFGSPPPLRLSSPPPATRSGGIEPPWSGTPSATASAPSAAPPPLARPRLSSRRARLCPEREEEEERVRAAFG